MPLYGSRWFELSRSEGHPPRDPWGDTWGAPAPAGCANLRGYSNHRGLSAGGRKLWPHVRPDWALPVLRDPVWRGAAGEGTVDRVAIYWVHTQYIHQIQPEYGEWAGWRGTGRPNPPRETKFSGANGDMEMFSFPVQLITSRIGNLTRLIRTLQYVMTTYQEGILGYSSYIALYLLVLIQ